MPENLLELWEKATPAENLTALWGRATPIKPIGAVDAGIKKPSETLKALERGIAGVGKSAGLGLEYLAEELKRPTVEISPAITKTLAPFREKPPQILPNIPLPQKIESLGKRMVAASEESFKRHPEWQIDPELEKKPWYDPKRLGVKAIETAPLTVAGVGAGAVAGLVTRNPFIAAGVTSTMFGLTSAGEIFKEAKDAGMSPEDALKPARIGGLSEGALEFVPGYMFMRLLKIGKPLSKVTLQEGIKELGRLRKIAKGAGLQGLVEGLTEGSQTAKDNLIAQRYYEPERDILKDVPESAALGAIMGVGLGGAGAVTGEVLKPSVETGLDFGKIEEAIPEKEDLGKLWEAATPTPTPPPIVEPITQPPITTEPAAIVPEQEKFVIRQPEKEEVVLPPGEKPFIPSAQEPIKQPKGFTPLVQSEKEEVILPTGEKPITLEKPVSKPITEEVPIEKGIPVTLKPQEKFKETLTSEKAQKAIDDFTDILVEKYGEEEALKAPIHPEEYKKFNLPVPKTKISESELRQLENLYNTRDAIEEKDFESWKSTILKESKIPEKEMLEILEFLGFKKGSFGIYRTAENLRNWTKDITYNLEAIYNHFAYSDIPYQGSYAKFRWGGTGEKPILEGSVFDEDLRSAKWDMKALRKTQEVYNAISKTQGIEPINLLNIAKGEKRKGLPTGEAAPVVSKEPWQMTRDKYIGRKPKDFTPEMNTYQARYQQHGWAVEKAISEGKPVPPEVLKDYPELKQETTDIYNKPVEEIFIREITPTEIKSLSARRIGLNKIPTKEGYEIIYKPYGVEGKGFYYRKHLPATHTMPSGEVMPGAEHKEKAVTGYKIDKNIIEHSRLYGISSVPVFFKEAHKVNIKALPNQEVIVYKGANGWIVHNTTIQEVIGREKAGIGWRGFDTPKEAVENYIKQTTLTKEEEAVAEHKEILQEAMKYDNVDDFINSTQMVYRGTHDLKETTSPNVYFTTNRDYADLYSTKNSNLNSYFFPAESPIRKANPPLHTKLKGSRVEEIYLIIKNPFVVNEPFTHIKSIPEGYDSVISKEKNIRTGKIVDVYVVRNKSQIKTKAQLINIYNKARATIKPTMEAEIQGQTKLFSQKSEEVSKSVDDYIGEFTPPVGLSVKDITKVKTINDDIKLATLKDLESTESQVEKEMVASEGLSYPSITDKLADVAIKLKHEFTRHFEFLNPKTDGKIMDMLRVGEALPKISKLKTIQILRGITYGFGSKKMKVFSRYLILGNELRNFGNGIPFKFRLTEEIARADLEKYQKIVDANPDIKEAIDKRNGFMESLRQELIAKDLLPKEVAGKDYWHQQTLEVYAEKQFFPGRRQDIRLGKKTWQHGRTLTDKNYNTNYFEAEQEVIQTALESLETKKLLEKLKPLVDRSSELKTQAKQLAEQEGKDEDVILKELMKADKLTEWRVKRGTQFYKAVTVSEKALDAAIEGTRQLTEEDKKYVFAAGRSATWIVPERMAKTFDNLRVDLKEGMPEQISEYLLSSWKQVILFQPLRFAKYFANNLSGDLDITFAFRPQILMPKYLMKSIHELFAHYRGKAMTGDLMDFAQRDGVSSGMTIQEIPDVTAQGIFQLISKGKGNPISWYFDKIKNVNTLRENALRYAAYRFFLEKARRGIIYHAASNGNEIDAMPRKTDEDLKDISAKLARELLGDYGNVSVGGQYMAKRIYPFWRWVEINTPRYARLFKNSAYDYNQEGKQKSGWKEAGTWSARGAIRGITATSRFLMYALTLYGLIEIWNRTAHTFMPGDFPKEDELAEAQRKQKHLILGRNSDGTVRTIRAQGALSDVFNWLGIETLIQDVHEDKPVLKIAKDVALAPVQTFAQGIHPVAKTLAEVIYGKTFYPDLFHPRPIRDKIEAIAKLWAVDMPYRHIAGKPTVALKEEIRKLLLYDTDAGESAYYTTRGIVSDFKKKYNVEMPAIEPIKKSNALYYYKKALVLKDEVAAEKYLIQYKQLGGTYEGLQRSIKMADPFYGMAEEGILRLLEEVTLKQKESIFRGMDWYHTVFDPQ